MGKGGVMDRGERTIQPRCERERRVASVYRMTLSRGCLTADSTQEPENNEHEGEKKKELVSREGIALMTYSFV
jgi:hypothetical protein